MSRSRNIKPGFFKNEQLAELSFEYRLLFQGLWCLADREGRLEDRPKRIRAEIFPYEDVNVEFGLRELAVKGFIVRYENETGRYIEVTNFFKHQNPHKKEAASIIPAPEIPALSLEKPGISGTSRADSFNLIPDPIVPTTSGEKPPPEAAKPEPDPIFGHGLAFLRSKNIPERGARSFLGAMRKHVGDVMAAELLAAAETEDVSDPIPWLRKAAEARQRAGPMYPKSQSRTAKGLAILESMKHAKLNEPRGTVVPQLDSGRSTKAALP